MSSPLEVYNKRKEYYNNLLGTGEQRLLNNKAIGLVSTHDLELEVLEKENNKRIRNYDFKEHYKNNKIYFNYKLKPGISTTRNAMYLIRMLGIDD